MENIPVPVSENGLGWKRSWRSSHSNSPSSQFQLNSPSLQEECRAWGFSYPSQPSAIKLSPRMCLDRPALQESDSASHKTCPTMVVGWIILWEEHPGSSSSLLAPKGRCGCPKQPVWLVSNPQTAVLPVPVLKSSWILGNVLLLSFELTYVSIVEHHRQKEGCKLATINLMASAPWIWDIFGGRKCCNTLFLMQRENI